MEERTSFSCAVLIVTLSSLLFLTRPISSQENLQLNDDVLGLIVFKSSLQDPQNALETWNEDDPSPCSWQFIKCSPSNNRVSEVSLEGLSLSGKIGRGLENLQSLKVLSLAMNNLSGSISPQLALLPNLERLNLSKNSLSGNIISHISPSLQFLDLSENSLSGPLPDAMFENCGSLRFLSLAHNRLEGPIPSTLSKCAAVNHLNLSSNSLSGNPSFAGGIWSFTRLRTLDLSENSFSGSIPPGVAMVHNLKELVLSKNRFSGTLPGDIGLCPHLTKVDLAGNMLAGEAPQSLQRLTALTFLSLADNSLAGDFPQWIGQLTSLNHLDLSSNGFAGSLPQTIGGLKSLNFLGVSNNKLAGEIPGSIGLCSSLSVVRMKGNALSGNVPDSLFDMELDELDLSRNNFSGFIPHANRKLFEALQVLDLSQNGFQGDIPSEMGLLSKLRYLNLSWNRLESKIPPQIGYFQNLTVLDLRYSGLVGSIPGDVCGSGNLAILQLDGNTLAGPIPEDIGNCTSLYLLSLSHNNLSGPIPRTLSWLSKLKILKLEANELSGEIPQELGKLDSLLIVNVSHNRLVGRLPSAGVFQTLDASAIEGNLGLCSPLLKGPCKLNVPKPLVLDPYAYGTEQSHQRSRGSHHRFLSASAIVAISAAAVIAVGVVIITLLNASARRRIEFIENALESMCSSSSTRSSNLAVGKLVWLGSKPSIDGHPSLGENIESALVKASEIGEGVFGKVYRVGGFVIKKLANTLQYHEEFDREVRILAKARNPNLNPIRGYYWTPQLQLIVADYAEEGSLQAKLHEPSPSSSPLTWPERFKVIIGTAKALAYLHHSFRPPIVHYGIKPSNVLLDSELNVKICDFGLTRLVNKGADKHLSDGRFQTAPGYVAPEMACQSLRVNEKCDVYGFGVLILEIVTGRRAIEYGEENMVILSDHVKAMLEQGSVLDCVDVKMGGQFAEEEVLPVLKLALVCTSQIPSSRPSMAEVVQILQVIKTPLPQRQQH